MKYNNENLHACNLTNKSPVMGACICIMTSLSRIKKDAKGRTSKMQRKNMKYMLENLEERDYTGSVDIYRRILSLALEKRL
jgi:hypothetical protein